MKIRTRLAALVLGLIAMGGLTLGAAAAAPPVKVEGCELVITPHPAMKKIAIPICWSGPPL